jgi:ApaG protein
VFEHITRDIAVRAEPMFQERESNPARGHYVWGYTIEVENRSAAPVQLMSRHWSIMDATGLTHDVRGEGVVGQQPIIPPGEIFRYTSVCPLTTPSGWMSGEYDMVEADTGAPFAVVIPLFALDSPHAPRPS